MADVENLRAVVRAQNLGDSLRRAEFQAILEALGPEESVLALAPAELRGREGYLVATERRVFFAHAGMAGTFAAPIASALEAVQYLENQDGSVSLIFRPGEGEEIQLDRIPRPHAEIFARFLTRRHDGGRGPLS
jgi:hypothetical protein